MKQKHLLHRQRTICVLLGLLFAIQSMAQLQTLTLPNKYLKLNSTGATLHSLPLQSSANPQGYTGATAKFASNSFYDSSGDLLFFIIDSKVYDGQGYFIGEMIIDYGFNNPLLPTTEWAIIPVPDDCCKFYIVGAYLSSGLSGGSENIYPSGLYYTTLDMCVKNKKYPNDENRYGELEFDPIFEENVSHLLLNMETPSLDNAYLNGYLAVSDLQNGTRKLFLTRQNNVVRFTVSSTGIVNDNAGFNFQGNSSLSAGYFSLDKSENELTKLTNGNYILAVPNVYLDLDGSGQPETVAIGLYELDGNFNLINTSFCYTALTDNTNYKGIEFSPNGQYIYFTSYQAPYTGYYDISNLSSPQLNALSQITNPIDYRLGFIERGYDGNLYYAFSNGLATLTNPNLPSSSVFNPTAFSFTNTLYVGHYPTNPANSKCYTLPDQLDLDNFDSFVGDPASSCCERYTGYDLEFYSTIDDPSVTTSQTWSPGVGNNPWDDLDGVIYVSSELRISSGYTITMLGLTFKFAPEAKMIIEKNARVTSNGSTFTSLDCDGLMWRGVEVWGTAGVAHVAANNANYGYFSLVNGSVVSNALTGITTCKRDANNNYDLTVSGGYVVATSSNFINNRIDVDITPLLVPNFPTFIPTLSNKCTFRNCNFRTAGLLKDNSLPSSHVQMVQVSGVKFYNNTFENTTPSLYPLVTTRGTGIYSVDSKYFVTYGCSSFQLPNNPCPEQNRIGNTFSHLYYGINASSANPLRNFVVEYSNFNEVHRGIRMVGMLLCKIDKNDFYIGEVNPNTNIPSYGIHQTNCSGYHLQNNHFEDANNANYGVVTVNSGAFNNLIRNNTFEDLEYGATAIQTNYGFDINQQPNYIGLQYLCNDFTGSSEVDVQVTSGGIREKQGLCPTNLPPFDPQLNASPANNTFSPVTPPLLHFTLDQMNVVQNTTYIYPSSNLTSFIVDPANVTAGPYSESGCTDASYTTKTEVCGENTYAMISNGQLLSKIDLSKSEIAALIALIDGGSTQSLLNAIASQSNGQVKNTLMAASPYLSDEVLLAYLATNPPAGHIKQIILANSPVSQAVLDYLNGMNLPNGIRNQINAGQTGESGMDVLRDDVSAVVWEKDMATDELLRRYLNDTINDQLDSMDIVLKANQNVESDAIRVAVKVYQGNFTDAATLINDIRLITNQYDDYLKLMESLIIIYQCQDKAYRLNWDTPLKQDVEAIANAGTEKIECKNAGSILELLKIFSQPEVFENVNPANARSVFDEVLPTEKAQSFAMYPNPADNFVNLQTDKTYELVEVYVYDITGKQIQYQKVNNADYVLLEASKLNSGIYLVEVKMNGSKTEVQKLIIE